MTGEKINIEKGQIHLRDQAKIAKWDGAYLDIYSNHHINIQANDKKGTILLNGGNMTVKIENNKFCIDDICIDKTHLQNLRDDNYVKYDANMNIMYTGGGEGGRGNYLMRWDGNKDYPEFHKGDPPCYYGSTVKNFAIKKSK